MRRRTRNFLAPAVAVASIAVPASVFAQAFTLPQGLGAVTLAWQYVDNTGHRLTDGFLRKAGESETASVILETEYGFTDRLSATVAVPYVFAKYTGNLPPPSGLPVDRCACWHSGWQDVSIGGRYRLGTDAWAFTPHFRYVFPSHDYPYQGEAVLGRNLNETQVGASAGAKLPGPLSKASLQVIYSYAFVEEVADVSIDRSNVFLDLGYAVGRRLYVRASAHRHHTHGGLQFGSPTGRPFFPPGELNTPERFSQRDRLLKSRFWQAGGGLSYSVGPADVFFAYSAYVWGRDAHDGQVYTVGATWYFDLGK